MIEHVQISLPKGRSVDARLIRRTGRELAIMLPGLNYSADAPLFYYIGQMMDERGVDALSVDFPYNRDEAFLSDTDSNRLERLRSDGRAIIDYAVALGKYDRITIIGKSVGSISMGWALHSLPNARLVWLTPSLTGTGLLDVIDRPNPAFCLIGTRDPGYTPENMHVLEGIENLTIAVIKDADHGISHTDGAAASVGLVQQSIEKLTKWLDATD